MRIVIHPANFICSAELYCMEYVVGSRINSMGLGCDIRRKSRVLVFQLHFTGGP